jgi:hypothetical protein
VSQWTPLATALVVVYALVVLSGLWGVYLQQRLPTRLLQEVPDETIRSQVPELTEQLRREAELLVLATCGSPAEGRATGLPLTLKNHIEVVRAARSGKGSGLLDVLPPEPVPDTEALRRYFEEVVDPYLRPAMGRTRLRLRARVDKDFCELKAHLPEAAQPVIDALHGLCQRRRQFEEQARLHDRLHGWVGLHLCLSALLLVLLIGHAVTAPFYW